MIEGMAEERLFSSAMPSIILSTEGFVTSVYFRLSLVVHLFKYVKSAPFRLL